MTDETAPEGANEEVRTELRDVARRIVGERSPTSRVRDWMEDARGFDPDLWKTFAGLGWPGLEIPEPYGGSGLSFQELAVVIQELGRGVVPSPLFSTAVLGAGAILAAGSEAQRDELLPQIAAGDIEATVALGGPSGRYDDAASGVHVRGNGDDLRLDGEVGFVSDAQTADLVIVAAHDESGPSLVLVDAGSPGLEVAATPTVDRTRQLCRLSLRDVRARAVLGHRGAAQAAIDRLLERAAVALAADALGGAERVLEMSVAYSKERIQFDRPIGSFQAVKHHCANMLVAVETSRVAAEAAAREISRSATSPTRWAAIAKSHCTDAYADVAGLGVQVHGGIGFTWEHDLHLYLKRAKLDQAWFGSPEWHRERLARMAIGVGSAIGRRDAGGGPSEIG